jgi:hypothetical protein
MALMGQAALAMWWNMAPEVRADFEDWHAHEHFPERLGIPGFHRGTRWSAVEGEGMFVMYEMRAFDVLSSPAYVARLNAPTPWSTRLMSHHRDMVRSQCRVLASRGGGVARHALTVRLSPAPDGDEALRDFCRTTIDTLAMRPGLTGAHLLQHETPAMQATTEQKIRGNADRWADWVLVVSGYDRSALEAASDTDLADAALLRHGAAAGPVRGLYALACTATPADVT